MIMRFDKQGRQIVQRFDRQGNVIGPDSPAPVTLADPPAAPEAPPEASAACTLPEAAALLNLNLDAAEDLLRAHDVPRRVAYDRASVERLREVQ